jgi:predicted methyltransferase
MSAKYQSENPPIRLVEHDGQVTLHIAGGQAMQGWEEALMRASADLLCAYGGNFLEVGLGLGLSALHIAGKPGTRHHVVVEKYQPVIDLFRMRQPLLPPALELVHADFVDHLPQLESGALDGIFFDPALPEAMWRDASLWEALVPHLVRSLRIGGVFIPFFSTEPRLRWQYLRHFSRIVVERLPFRAYADTTYTRGTSGDAFIQCFIRTT